MSEETFGFTEEELKKLEKASDEWNICSEKTGRIWELFLNDDEYNDTEGENDLIPYRQYLMQRWIIINRSQYKGADRHKLVKLLMLKKITDEVFNEVVRELTGRSSGVIDDLTKKLERRLNRIMGEVLYEGKKVPAYKILTMNSSKTTPTLLTRENCRFFDLLLRKDDTTNLCILTPSILHSTPICTTLLSQIKPCMMPWMNLRDILLLTVTRLHVAVILAR